MEVKAPIMLLLLLRACVRHPEVNETRTGCRVTDIRRRCKLAVALYASHRDGLHALVNLFSPIF